MSEMVKIFDFEETAVRVQLVDDEPWWVANDIAAVLQLEGKGSHNLSPLDEDEKQQLPLMTNGGVQHVWMINESGLYGLIFRSRKEKARRFRKWVTSDVLPSLRKHGEYRLAEAIAPKELVDSFRDHELVKAAGLEDRLGLLRSYTRHFGRVQGRRYWVALGLPILPEDMTDDLMAGSAAVPVADFARERIVPDTGHRERAAVLYEAYVGWCHAHEVTAASQKAFGAGLAALGIGRVKASEIYYVDIRLRKPQALAA